MRDPPPAKDEAAAKPPAGVGALQVGKGPTAPGSAPPPAGEVLPLPHERDQAIGSADEAPREVIKQAKRDLDAGQVDTDMWATPGLDADKRRRLVPGPGGAPPAKR